MSPEPAAAGGGAAAGSAPAEGADREAVSTAAGDASSVPRALIDTAALVHNYREACRLACGGAGVLAMIKSDAYGHGASLCAAALERAGCRIFGVASVDEARQLAEFSDRGSRVVVFGGILAGEADAALAAGAEVVTQEIDVVRALAGRAAASGREAVVHVKLDTGMHRLGVVPDAIVEFVRAAAALRGVRIVAVCSHFAQAESVTGGVTAGQLETMLAADAALKAAGFSLTRHLANSAAILARPEAHLDLVRPGIMLYGVAPDPSLRGRAQLRPVMRLVARVVRVADVAAGEGVGYGHTFHTNGASRIATIRCGYADGYPRNLGNVAEAAIRGRRVPVAGRICMDHTMLDVTGVAGASVGDDVTLWGADPLVEEVASRAGTIAYELLARVAARVRREEAGAAEQERNS
jgi:alanine racemase